MPATRQCLRVAAVATVALCMAACTNTNTAPTGALGLANSGAGPQVGASAGSSVGGGPLGAGTDDNRAGAK